MAEILAGVEEALANGGGSDRPQLGLIVPKTVLATTQATVWGDTAALLAGGLCLIDPTLASVIARTTAHRYADALRVDAPAKGHVAISELSGPNIEAPSAAEPTLAITMDATARPDLGHDLAEIDLLKYARYVRAAISADGYWDDLA